MADKTKSQTYNFLLENKTIEDILNQPNTTFKEKRRHGGSTFKIIEKPILSDDLSENNEPKSADENLEPIAISLTDNEKIQETNNDIWTKIKNYLNLPTANTEEISKLHITIQEQAKEIQQLKKENENLKQSKQSNINFDNFKYNTITIYDEKQIKNTGIEKIHEEILSIENKLFFITTFIKNNQSIIENIIYFQNFKNGDIKVFKQNKHYLNINEYKKELLLVDNKNANIDIIPIKEFLKHQQDFKLKPTKIERTLWCIFTAIAVLAGISTFIGVIILFFPTVAVIPAVAIGLKVVGTFSSISFIRIFASICSSATRKVDLWFGNKLYKNKEQKEKCKKERQSIIKNLSTNKSETKLQTQYDILKQELDNRKDKNPNKLISYKTINQNSSIELENNQNFDLFIRDTVNNQNPQPSTTSNHNWNKVKCLCVL